MNSSRGMVIVDQVVQAVRDDVHAAVVAETLTMTKMTVMIIAAALITATSTMVDPPAVVWPDTAVCKLKPCLFAKQIIFRHSFFWKIISVKSYFYKILLLF